MENNDRIPQLIKIIRADKQLRPGTYTLISEMLNILGEQETRIKELEAKINKLTNKPLIVINNPSTQDFRIGEVMCGVNNQPFNNPNMNAVFESWSRESD